MSDRRVIVFGADGLRPDLVDSATMPTLAGFINRGVRFTDHHAAWPSHTRVNATSFATGTHPGRHGIVANTMLVPGVTDDDIISTGLYQQLDQLAAHDPRGAQLVPSMSDVIHGAGYRMAVAGNGSSGSKALWSFRHRGRLINTGTAFGIADLYDLREKLGEVPDSAIPDVDRCWYVTRALTDIFLDDDDIRMMTLWLAEPDSTFHKRGLGSPAAIAALQTVDACLAHVLSALRERGIDDQVDVLFLSDHGHSTVRAHKSIREFLDDACTDLGPLPALATASDFIYTRPGTAEPTTAELAPLVEWLLAQPWCDIVAGGTAELAALPGVVSLAALWGGSLNDRRPLLAVSPTWSRAKNEFGVPGVVAALTTQGALKSSHGSLSPYDMHPFFAARGPSFREGLRSEVPTGNIDIAPTVLSILGLPIPESMEGRVVGEGLVAGEEPRPLRTTVITPQTPDMHERAVTIHTAGKTMYVHGSARPGDIA